MALVSLILMQGRALLRRALRGAKTPRGTILFGLGTLVAIFCMSAGRVYLMMHAAHSDPTRVRATAPLALLGVCILTLVTSAGDRAIAFTPGEVDLLFAAPFTRRQLILYKLTKSTFAAALTACFLSLTLLRHARWWPACYVGVLLTLLFVQFFSINAVIIAQTIGAAAWSKARRYLLFTIIVIAILWSHAFVSASASNNPAAVLQALQYSPVGRIVLAPFSVFGEAITAGSPGELVHWAGRALAINLVLLFSVLALDALYLDAAIAASGRRYAHMSRIRGGSFLSIGVKENAAWTLPMLPSWLGLGPTIWRQLTSAGRSSRGLLLLLLIVVLGAAPALRIGQPAQMIPTFITVLLWLTFLVSSMLKFDFRGDLDHLDLLKSLPMRPAALAAGQIVVPALLMTVAHWLLLGTVAYNFPQSRMQFMAAASIAPAGNLLLFALDNLIFLIFPSRPSAVSPGDFQMLGRQVVTLVGKMAALLAGATPALIAAAFLYALTNRSLVVFAIAANVLLCAEVLALLPAIGWAFNRFDPSVDTPA